MLFVVCVRVYTRVESTLIRVFSFISFLVCVLVCVCASVCMSVRSFEYLSIFGVTYRITIGGRGGSAYL